MDGSTVENVLDSADSIRFQMDRQVCQVGELENWDGDNQSHPDVLLHFDEPDCVYKFKLIIMSQTKEFAYVIVFDTLFALFTLL